MLSSSALSKRERRAIHLTLIAAGLVVVIIGLFTRRELITLGIFLLSYGALSHWVDRRKSARKDRPEQS